MSAPQQSPIGTTNAAWRIRALEQFSACLAAAGKREDLEALLARFESQHGEAKVRYFLAIAFAAEGKLDQALGHLRTTMSMNGQETKARELAYKLLLNQADRKAGLQDWNGLSEVITEALSVAPPGVDTARDLERYKNALPIAHLRAGRRDEAIRLWEQHLHEDPNATRLIHHLALAHYWWAATLEKGSDRERLMLAWKGTIVYWTLLLQTDRFWDEWNQESLRRLGLSQTAEELANLRSELAEEQIAHRLQSRSSEHLEKEDEGTGELYEELFVTLLRERASAAAWKETIGALEREHVGPPDSLLRLPGGYLFFERFGRLSAVNESLGRFVFDSSTRSIQWEADKKRIPLRLSAECLARLHVYFSPLGLGLIAVMIDERHQPMEAIHCLERMPEQVQSSWPAAYLRVKAEAKYASILTAQGKVADAVKAWNTSRRLAVEWSSKSARFPGVLFAELLAHACEEAAKAVQKEAARLKKEQKQDQAIGLVEQSLDLDRENALRDLVCVLYCDRGSTHLGSSRYNAAREDFNRALRLNSQHQRAKEGLSTTYNNEGCETSDVDKAIRLFEKAIEINPNNHQAERNLATSLKSKAVENVNKALQSARYLGRYSVEREINNAIDLLGRAARMVNPKLDPELFRAIEMSAMLGDRALDDLFRQVDDDILKDVLTNLGVAYKMRYQIRTSPS
jgi:tetratricopeptide (TPR) repeat protein